MTLFLIRFYLLLVFFSSDIPWKFFQRHVTCLSYIESWLPSFIYDAIVLWSPITQITIHRRPEFQTDLITFHYLLTSSVFTIKICH